MRFDHVTLLKTLCLLGVILLHALEPFTPPGVFWQLFSERKSAVADMLAHGSSFFIIPSFMAASGYLLLHTVTRKGRSFAGQLANRARRLLVPWFFMMLLWMAPLYTLFDLPTYNRPAGSSLGQTYAAALNGTFTDHLWFLLVLFWVSLFWLAALPLVKRAGVLAGFALAFAACLLMDRFGRGLTWYCLWECAGPLLYFYLGCALYHYREGYEALAARRGPLMLAALAAPFALLVSLGRLPAPLYWLACCLAVLIAFQLCLRFAAPALATLRRFAPYRFFEDNSFRCYLFHMPGGLLAFKLLDPLTGIPPLAVALLSFTLNFALTLGIVAALNEAERRVKGLRGNS